MCRHHIHMNSTKWYTLTEFVQHLSKTGQVRADLTDKGWFISVIQPDPEEKLAEERRSKRDRAERVSAPAVLQAVSEVAACALSALELLLGFEHCTLAKLHVRARSVNQAAS